MNLKEAAIDRLIQLQTRSVGQCPAHIYYLLLQVDPVRHMHKYIGIDFGTTNSAVAVARDDGSVSMVQFPAVGGMTDIYRSLIYFERVQQGRRFYLRAHTGPEAIMHYLAAEEKGRLIQSLKALLPSTLVHSTTIFGRPHLFEDLVAFLVQQLLRKSESLVGDLGPRSVLGRPVRFSSKESGTDDVLAMQRLQSAFVRAGMVDTRFEYEPVAAAYFYETLLNKDELILAADFGGGTSDFSLLRVGPSFRGKAVEREILGSEGIASAGDAFDAKIVRHLVSPLLGLDSPYRSMGKLLLMPVWIYIQLEKWHHLSFLKSKETMDVLASLRAMAVEPERIENLINIIDGDLGFHLHQAVQKTKVELSEQETSVFSFQAPGVSISTRVTRKDFNTWIEEELQLITGCLDRLLSSANVKENEIDRVFMTGGSSFVPAVRQIFLRRFGANRLATGSEFTSVAKGLALRSLELTRLS
jgi:hypothetical chaperone protein